jgi:hypothetical protein
MLSETPLPSSCQSVRIEQLRGVRWRVEADQGRRPQQQPGDSIMADNAVTLEDLQKVYKRLEALESGLKEVVRLQKIQDDYDKDMNKTIVDNTKSGRDDMKKLEGRVTDLEKKMKK